jgi:purine-cytosine permease-like protein
LDIARLLDAAFDAGAPLVYGQALNQPSHGFVRNTFSRLAKTLTALVVGNRQLAQFNSFRLVRGDIARSLAAYCGHGVYLDVALAWVVGSVVGLLMIQTQLFQGPLANIAGGVDISLIAGSVVAAVLYLALIRGRHIQAN